MPATGCTARDESLAFRLEALIPPRRYPRSSGFPPNAKRGGLPHAASLEKAARTGWAEAARLVATQGEDELLMGEFANAADLELEW
jgi:hypothetical protein